jgi:hypothetical protein
MENPALDSEAERPSLSDMNILVMALGAALLGLHSGALRAEPDPQPFPQRPSVKGLQVQMVPDALSLGIHHAALNVNLGQLALVPPGRGLEVKTGQSVHRFNADYLRSLDAQIKPLSDAGVVVYLIMLVLPTADSALNQILLHPGAHQNPGFTVGAFNTASAEGRAWLRAAFDLLAQRYSGSQSSSGRVWGWIVGNEVNSHFMWHGRGPCSLEELARDYEQAVRLAHDSLRLHSAHARVYLSFDHHWARAHLPKEPQKSVPGRDLLDAFARQASNNGDFEWHIAWHPYHSNLFATELWNDPQAPRQADAPNVTFHNLEILTQHLQRRELLWQGKPRRVILSEQGFHTPDGTQAEQRQAAAFVYAWEKVSRLPGIDAFIYHRQVDHAQEGGLRLGLWERQAQSVATPLRPKLLHAIFAKAGSPQWPAAAAELLPISGLKSWAQ